jgi:hypothetical protein
MNIPMAGANALNKASLQTPRQGFRQLTLVRNRPDAGQSFRQSRLSQAFQKTVMISRLFDWFLLQKTATPKSQGLGEVFQLRGAQPYPFARSMRNTRLGIHVPERTCWVID